MIKSVERFNAERTSVADARSGRASTVSCRSTDVKDQDDQSIRYNERLVTDKINMKRAWWKEKVHEWHKMKPKTFCSHRIRNMCTAGPDALKSRIIIQKIKRVMSLRHM